MGLDIHFASPNEYEKHGNECFYTDIISQNEVCSLEGRHAVMRVIDHMPHFCLRAHLEVSLGDLITEMLNHVKFYSQQENINNYKYPENFEKYWTDERFDNPTIESDIEIMRSFIAELLTFDIPLDWIIYGDW